jgi:8-oxo-dGTP diphosphatase
MKRTAVPDSVSEIEWRAWKPTERAVLLFIQEGEKLLLIHKKKGLGAGKINAPGGRIEPNETPRVAAIRETIEEVGMEPINPEQRGEVFFQFKDGYKLHGEIFFSTHYSGVPTETEEAGPFWCDIDSIPYEKMWEDDQYWLPLALDSTPFKAYFIFDDDRMVDKKIEIENV